MTKRQIDLQARQLMTHVVDAKGALEPKLVLAVGKAIAGSDWPHKRVLLRQFIRLVNRLERRQTAVVTSVKALPEAEQATIQQSLHRRYPEVVSIEWRRQPDLIAGLAVVIDDTWYDLSIQQRLLQIQEHLG